MIAAMILFVALCAVTGLVVSEVIDDTGWPKFLLLAFLFTLSAIASEYMWGMIHA